MDARSSMPPAARGGAWRMLPARCRSQINTRSQSSVQRCLGHETDFFMAKLTN